MYVYMPNKEGGHSGMPVQKHTTPVYRQISRPQVQMVSGNRVVHQQRQGGYPGQRVIRAVPNDGSGQQRKR